MKVEVKVNTGAWATPSYSCSHSSLVLWDATHKKVRVQVKAIRATGALAHNRALAIHRQCALAPMP